MRPVARRLVLRLLVGRRRLVRRLRRVLLLPARHAASPRVRLLLAPLRGRRRRPSPRVLALRAEAGGPHVLVVP